MEMLVKDVSIIIVFTILFVLLLWCIDVTVSTINVNCIVSKSPSFPFSLSSFLLTNVDPVKVYHFALVSLLLLWVFFILLYINRFSKEVTL